MHLDDLTVVHNKAGSQFEIALPDDTKAVAVYRWNGDRMAFTHTAVPSEYEGEGIGSKLIREALDYARSHDLTVLPYCPFVRAFIANHAAYHDLVPATFRS